MKRKVIVLVAFLTTLLSLQPLFALPLWAIGLVVALFGVVVLIWTWADIRIPPDITLQPVQTFSSTPDFLVFAYGSLLVRRSLLRTIPADACQMECIPAYLRGYSQQWGAARTEWDFIDRKGRPVVRAEKWVSLVAVRSSPENSVPGAVLGLSNRGYFAIVNRERRYRQAEVRAKVDPAAEGEAHLPDKPIFAFLPRNDEYGPLDDSPTLIRRTYFRGVSQALRKLGLKRLSKPKRSKLSNVFLVSERMEDICRSRRGEGCLRNIRDSISSDIAAVKENRERKWALTPLCLARRQYQEAADCAERAVDLSARALRVLSETPEFLQFGRWTEEDHRLLTYSIERDEHHPRIARVDMTISGNRLLVLEVNADSPGGMRHHDILSEKQSALQRLDSRLHWLHGQPSDLCEHVFSSILASYHDFKGDDTLPSRAVLIEYRPQDWPTWPEMQFFRDEFRRRGISSDVLDLSQAGLSYSDCRLAYGNDKRHIDLIYKRILWSDMQRTHESTHQGIAKAYLESSTCVVNSPGARMAGSKLILAMLKAKQFPNWLKTRSLPVSDADIDFIQQHIPYTAVWGDTPTDPIWSQDLDRELILGAPAPWVLKSFHGFGGQDVVIGCTADRPSASFESLWNDGYILQEYVPHGRTLVARSKEGSIRWEYHHFILGAYVIDGRCVAIEAKTSVAIPISMAKQALRTSVFTVRGPDVAQQ